MKNLSKSKIAIIIPDFDNGGEEHRVVFFVNNYILFFKEVYLICPYGVSLNKLDSRIRHFKIDVRNPFNIYKVLRFVKKKKNRLFTGT